MTAEVAAIATLNNAAKQIYNIEGDLWQEAYETREAVINKTTKDTIMSPCIPAIIAALAIKLIEILIKPFRK